MTPDNGEQAETARSCGPPDENNKQQQHATASETDGTSPSVASAESSDESFSSLSSSTPCVCKNDPHDLIERFVNTQRKHFPRALREITFAGSKMSCWFWFVLPTLPYIVNGVESGSPNNKKYSLKNDEQVKAYVQLPTVNGVNLRENYIAMVGAIEKQLRKGNTLPKLLGPVDAPKAISSFELFERIGNDMEDEELVKACRKVLKAVNRKSFARRVFGRQSKAEPKRPMLSY